METNIEISKFWTRVWAFFVDGVILGVLGYAFSLPFQDYLVNLGHNALVIGLVVAVAYQTIGNSRIANGQTIGKRLLGIQVVDIHGNTIGVGKSLLRALTLCIPYFAINLPIPGFVELSPVNIVKATVLEAVLLCIGAVCIFNKTTRQSLHDLVAGTYVATVERLEQPVIMPSASKASFYAVGVIAMLLIGGIIFGSLYKNPVLDGITASYKKVLQVDGVLRASVLKTTTYGITNNGQTSAYNVKIWVSKLPVDTAQNDKVLRNVVSTLLADAPGIDSVDAISITLIRQFDIGIAQQSNAVTIRRSPVRWRTILGI